ncbi:MAG: hypothetical protein Hens3KO_21230 [Henriciella sp.]
MTVPSALSLSQTPQAATAVDLKAATKPQDEDIGLQFEKMLWAEMLSHAGFEDALTMNGGESASAFSRFIIDEIATDLAAISPLGFSDKIGLYAVVQETSDEMETSS